MADFLETLFDSGAEGRRWRSPWAIAGAVLGAVAGGVLGYAGWDILGTLGGVATGALLGWVAAILLRGLGVFLLVCAAGVLVALGWIWLEGKL